MRVSERLLYHNVTSGLGRLSSDLQRLNLEVSTQRKLLKPSDDPVGTVASMTVQSRLDALDQQKRNCEGWQGWLQSTEGAVSSAGDVVSRAREIAVQMSNGTYDASQRQSAAKEVDNLLEEMVSLGNTQYAGRSVFAGFREDSAAFETTEAGGHITAVTYAGDEGVHEAKLGPNSRLETSLTGSSAFQGSVDIFQSLIDLRDSLEANDPSAAAQTLDGLRNATSHLAACQADVGSKLSRIEQRLSLIEDTKLSDTDRLSQLEDADLVETVTALQSKEVAYQAALQTATMLQNLNLAQYL